MGTPFFSEDGQTFDFGEHWNKAYQKTPLKDLGWFEEQPLPTLELIDACGLSKDACIFHAGAGATTLIGELLHQGYTNLIVNDIAAAALTALKNDLPFYKKAQVRFVVDDLTQPSALLDSKQVDCWHDRAVLHFFTEEYQQQAYFGLLKHMVKTGGYVLLSEFSLEGAAKCCGLEVFRYDVGMFQERLGPSFTLLKSFQHTYIQPSGQPRPYIYALFQRTDD
ncbi:MAG: class I SAM-dependent methyltransferase [Lutibacter sp.]|nr:class I SAM-dependent methyltransferase [Lutibacter sp.]